MSQQNVKTAAHESSETIFLTTKNVPYRHIRENLYQHIETGMTYTASSDGRLFDPVDLKEISSDGLLIMKPIKNEKGLIKIGQVIEHKRYGKAVVYGIHGVQGLTPVKVLGGGVVVTGGSAKFDIIYYEGTRYRHLPESILLGGSDWYVREDILAQEEIDKLLKFSDEKEAKEKADQEKEKIEFNNAISDFKVSDKYKHLIQGSDKYSGKLAAKNIRIELKKQFNGVKFSVRKNHFGSITISWIDGPKKDDVNNICSKYKTGRFNAYEDYHYDDVSAFNEVFGSASYISLTREYSDEFINEAIGILVDKYEYQFAGKEKPTVEDYRTGRLYNVGQEFCTRSLQNELSEILWEL
ncbi:hypothetical protein I2494_17930 [Budviciaceae bacterium BWR-B9]|uniref:Large polyvalent protein associated domain-containing protein n=1 Tax=Limnobaculum allomyrinae TaxID=2791986 RepID=A0ABS1IV52_9GAMM|nr:MULTISPECIES: LPD29 domain-containing protein [Limnobaculum]MBK5145562.1 hypothetical protein [Limnobaculum allomyrinae]MBV7693680.1 hypothetical protein [Limnobaculum sp. M2-1]